LNAPVFNWLSYLDVADHLLGQQGEGFYRSAVSRAYYGIFGHTRDVLERVKGIPFPRGRNVHWDVINALKNDPRQEVNDLGNDLERLRDQLNDADYHADTGIDLSWAQNSVSEAKSIHNRLASLFPSDSRG
jgi:uncharacterized protein (UPF0332 family)